MKDLVNDKNVTNVYEPFRGLNEISGVKFTEMSCSVLNMNYFDIFKELGMVTEKGDIRQDFEERVDGMVLGDRIRKAWLFEDTEDIEGWDGLHQPKY